MDYFNDFGKKVVKTFALLLMLTAVLFVNTLDVFSQDLELDYSLANRSTKVDLDEFDYRLLRFDQRLEDQLDEPGTKDTIDIISNALLNLDKDFKTGDLFQEQEVEERRELLRQMLDTLYQTKDSAGLY